MARAGRQGVRVKLNPDISDEALMKVIEQNLRFDMSPQNDPANEN